MPQTQPTPTTQVQAASFGEFELGKATLKLTYDEARGVITDVHASQPVPDRDLGLSEYESAGGLLLPEQYREGSEFGSVYGKVTRAGGETEAFNTLGMTPQVTRDEIEPDGQDAPEAERRQRVQFDYDFAHFGLSSAFSEHDDYTVRWQITVENTGGAPLTFESLGFPLPIHNQYYEDTFSQTDEGLTRLWETCYYVHRYIGGHGSYVLARRLNGQRPSFLFYTHADTPIEFTHMRMTGWEGIPQLFIASAGERPGFKTGRDWYNGHRSIQFAPGETKTYTFFLRHLHRRTHAQGPHEIVRTSIEQSLLEQDNIVVQAFPGMVIPQGTSATMLVRSGRPFVTANQISVEPPAIVRPAVRAGVPLFAIDFQQRGEHVVTIRRPGADGEERWTKVHFYATEPAESLFSKRASFIKDRQVMTDPDNPITGAILPWNRAKEEIIYDTSNWGSGGYEGGITDAMLLARWNALHPNQEQIDFLEEYIDDYVLNKLQNPQTFEVAWIISGDRPARMGRIYNYLHNVNLYWSMYLIARDWDATERRNADEYLDFVMLTTRAMFEKGWVWHMHHVGFMGWSSYYDILPELRRVGRGEDADWLEEKLRTRGEKVISRQYPYSAEPLYDTTGYEDVYFTSRFLEDWDKVERTINCAMAQKAYSPSWFWAGSDKRYWDAMEDNPREGYYGTDQGENAMHYTTSLTGLVGLEAADRLKYVPESTVFLKSYAGLLGMLSLIHEDGSASMCYTPDPLSNHAGFNKFTGDSGLGLYGYLRAARAEVRQPMRSLGLPVRVGFGCVLTESNQTGYTARLTDGVYRHFRDYDADLRVTTERAHLREITFRENKRFVSATMENPWNEAVEATLTVDGIWGKNLRATGGDSRLQAAMGEVPVVTVSLEARERLAVTLQGE